MGPLQITSAGGGGASLHPTHHLDFLFGITLFGLNMLITCLLFRMNRNDAFSALKTGAYTNFLRFRLSEDEFDMYVVGLDQAPSRKDWIANKKHDKTNPDHSNFAALPQIRIRYIMEYK